MVNESAHASAACSPDMRKLSAIQSPQHAPVGALPQVTEEELWGEFVAHGQVVAVQAFSQSGYAFVTFREHSAAVAAIVAMNGRKLQDRVGAAISFAGLTPAACQCRRQVPGLVLAAFFGCHALVSV